MRCLLPPHKPLSFPSYSDYETHYASSHTNRCITCRANFPSPHYLSLHLAEFHDPILASKRADGEKTYTCFVEGCDKVCVDWKKRRAHLVDKHDFPRNYDFLIVEKGIDGRRSLLRAGVDENGHRKSSRDRGWRGSVATDMTESTQGTEETEITPTSTLGEDTAEDGMKEGMEGMAQTKSTKPAGGDLDDLTKSMSALKMVPRSVTFGKRKGKSGFAKS